MGRVNFTFFLGLVLPLGVIAGYFLLLFASQGPFLDATGLFNLLSDTDLLAAIRLSFFSATVAAIAALIFAVPCGYALARLEFRGKGILDTFLDLPLVLTPIALGTLILMVLNTAPGKFLQELGISLPFTVGGVILAQFTVIVSIAIRTLKVTFESIPYRYEQVARLLGCTALGSFFQVALPLAKRGILASFILCWARALGEFGATVMVAGTAKGHTATLPSSIYLAMSVADLPRAVSLILVLILTSFLVLILIRLAGGDRS